MQLESDCSHVWGGVWEANCPSVYIQHGKTRHSECGEGFWSWGEKEAYIWSKMGKGKIKGLRWWIQASECLTEQSCVPCTGTCQYCFEVRLFWLYLFGIVVLNLWVLLTLGVEGITSLVKLAELLHKIATKRWGIALKILMYWCLQLWWNLVADMCAAKVLAS